MRFRISDHHHRTSFVELHAVNVDVSAVVAVDIEHATLAFRIDERDFQMVEPDLIRVGTRVVSRVREFDVRDATDRHANVVVHARIIPCPRSLCKGF